MDWRLPTLFSDTDGVPSGITQNHHGANGNTQTSSKHPGSILRQPPKGTLEWKTEKIKTLDLYEDVSYLEIADLYIYGNIRSTVCY